MKHPLDGENAGRSLQILSQTGPNGWCADVVQAFHLWPPEPLKGGMIRYFSQFQRLANLITLIPLEQLLRNQKLNGSYRRKNATFEERQGQLESYGIPDLQLHACKGAQFREP
jgi:hypothetical protein